MAKKKYLSCFPMEMDDEIMEDTQVEIISQENEQQMKASWEWKLYFNGAYSKEGNGAGVLLKSPEGNLIPFSYKLEFNTKYNIIEYEELVLGL